MTSSDIRKSFLDFFKSKQHSIVPSSSLMPDSPNLLFTNAGMNQFVPIFLGQVQCPYNPPRAADTQKCIRAGGKHNDLDDVGLDTYHHTFFEMLGNWSFGDYFKKEAIDWAWELVTGVWKFPKNRIYATVYSPDKSLGDPSEFDQEAHDFWAEKFVAAGLDPKQHIVNGNKRDNFWMMGETGPCGPCSELHVDLTPNGDTKGALVNKGSAECIEIWNLVFIQFNANPDGTFAPLPARHVDTGMGFERVSSIIQCTKNFTDFTGTISNYETDIFRPIFDKLEKMSGKRYGSTLPGVMGSTGDSLILVGDSPTRMSEAPSMSTNAGLQSGAHPHSAGPVARQDGQVARATHDSAGATYAKRNLPHFEKPWAIYHVTINTIAPRALSPAARDIVLDCILHWRESRYRLVAACVMPDHAHFIILPGVKEEDKNGNPVFWPLSEILHSIKSYSAKEINKLDNVMGTLWQEERYDRFMRGDSDLQEKFEYICRNPWAARLVQESEPWPWLWTPDAEEWKKGSTGDSPTRMSEASSTSTSASLQSGAHPHSAGPVARQDEQVARATQIQLDIAFRVIADHIRTLSFAIADGIQPGNTDRNYVLRRILRRAVRYGRALGFHEPFFYKLVDVLADTMGNVFPEIRAKKTLVQETIEREEEAFNKTLDRGIESLEESFTQSEAQVKRLNASVPTGAASLVQMGSTVGLNSKGDPIEKFVIKDGKTIITGSFAFELYDTYGFPLDLTELMARERGSTVDVPVFNTLMEQQKAISRAAQKKEVISLSQIETTTPTRFVGFEKLQTTAKVLEVVSIKDKTAVILDVSAAYAEMGGQVGDTGEISGDGQLWRVVNTQKSGNTWIHFIEAGTTRPQSGVSSIPVGGSPTGTGESPVLPIPGSNATLIVDRNRRNAIQRHHTVTHLLHWALHEVVSKEATQKGSFVGPDKLTFDFNSAALTPAQVSDIEKLVNERILENAGVSWIEVPYSDVKSRKDVMQFFGDKYGDLVRVVQIGGETRALNGYSMELCGGTHTRATGEIGLFRIVSEAAVAAGVRRIEAVAGLAAYQTARQEAELLRNVAGRVSAPLGELEKKVESLLAQQKELEKQLKSVQLKEAAQTAKALGAKAMEYSRVGVRAIIENLGSADGDYLQAVADALKGTFKGVVVLGGAANGAVSLVATVSADFTEKAQAGKIIQAIAPIVGGKGGGKPDNARGGGKDAAKLNEALAKARSLLE